MKTFVLLGVGLTLISTLILAGCNTTQQSSSTSPTSQASTSATNSGANFGALSNVVSATKAAVNAGNFSQATRNFDQFEAAWKQVEDGVKTKSPDGYSAIEDAATQVRGALKSSDKAKALAGLQTLETTIASVSRS